MTETKEKKPIRIIYAGAARKRKKAIMDADGNIERLEPKVVITHTATKIILNPAGHFKIKLDGSCGGRMMWGGRVFEKGTDFKAQGCGDDLVEAIAKATVVPYKAPEIEPGKMTLGQLESIEDGDAPSDVFLVDLSDHAED